MKLNFITSSENARSYKICTYVVKKYVNTYSGQKFYGNHYFIKPYSINQSIYLFWCFMATLYLLTDSDF